MASPEDIVEEMEPITEQSRQIWYIFSGMGSQWTGMGTTNIKYIISQSADVYYVVQYYIKLKLSLPGESLMKIPIFAEAIKKCDAVLKPQGYDIVRILCEKDPTIYDNIVNCFLGIAAVQVIHCLISLSALQCYFFCK